MSTEHIHSIAELDKVLAVTYHDHKQLALLVKFHSLHIAVGSDDAIRIATLMETLAIRLRNNVPAIAEAKYHRGLAYIERHKKRSMSNSAPDSALYDNDLKLAISDLKGAYNHFIDLEAERIEEQRLAERRRKLRRDKARSKDESAVAVNPDIECFHKRATSSALALGRAFMRRNALDEALKWSQNALKRVDVSAPNALAAAAYEALGEICRLLGNSEDALRHLRLAVAIRRELEDDEGAACALATLADVYHSMGDLDAAMEYCRQSLRLHEDEAGRYAMLGKERRELACRYRSIAVKSSIANVYLTRSEPVMALETALLALMAYEEFRDHESSEQAMATIGDIYDNIVRTHLTVGRAHAALRQWDSALDQYSEAYAVAQTHCPRRALLPIMLDVGIIHRELGIIHRKQEELDNAIQTFQNALSIADILKEAHISAAILKELATTCEKRENHLEALQYYKKYVEINTTISVDQRRKAITIARIQFDTEQKELEARLLRERNAMLENDLTDFLVNVGLGTDKIDQDVQSAAVSSGTKEISNIANQSSKASFPAKNAASRKWVYFQRRIEDLYSGFLAALTKNIPTLTPKQIQVCALLRLGLDQDQIISALGMKPRTLETHRNRIRRQLNCGPSENLVTYLTAITSNNDASQLQVDAPLSRMR